MNAPAILPTEKPKVQRLTYDEQDLVLLLLKHARTRYTAPDENYLKGLQGLHAADDALKKNNAHGLLIGGLGKSVWMWAKRNTNYLLTHSNVDVAVLDYSYQPTKNERGINWWNLKHANIKLHPHIASKFESVPYWTNYNNSPLTFGPRGELFQSTANKSKQPGLYIPSAQLFVDIKAHEATLRANVTERLNELILLRFREKFYAKNNHCKLHAELQDRFGEQTLQIGQRSQYIRYFRQSVYNQLTK